MLILAIDSSATAASAAVLEGNRLLGEVFVNTKQTHSQTLMPMVSGLLRSLGKRTEDFDLIAVSSGPGSFTGVRIAVSCVKGMAMPFQTPCLGVSTLEAIAYGQLAWEGKVICAVMDARCRQVYNGLFRIRHGVPDRICEDRALSIEQLYEECAAYGPSLVLAGDGAALCYESFSDFGALLSPEAFRVQRAAAVAMAAAAPEKRNSFCSPAALVPSYLRLPQAERELKKKQERKTSL